jgi:hypothetical protein
MSNNLSEKQLQLLIDSCYEIIGGGDVRDSRINRDWDTFTEADTYNKLLIRQAEYEKLVGEELVPYVLRHQHLLSDQIKRRYATLHQHSNR